MSASGKGEGAASVEAAHDVELSFVMPCLNEAQTIRRCIEDAQDFLRKRDIAGEIVVGDNGSSDASRGIAASLGARVVAVAERGYGAAIRGAVSEARGRFVLMGDADGSYDFTAVDAFLERLREGYQLVMGNRFLGGIEPGAMPWKNRWIGNPLLTAIGRLLFRSPVGDFHCGMRGFARTMVTELDLRTTGMEFASEMVVKATLRGLPIAEVPTVLRRDGRSRPSHLRPWRDGWRHLRFMLIYSPGWLFLVPGVVLFVAGLLLGTVLLFGPIYVMKIGFDLGTLVYAVSAMILGFEAMVFAVFSKTFAMAEGLLPEDDRLGRRLARVKPEVGLAVGFGLVGLGLTGTLAGVLYWESFSFGPLNPFESLRIVIPSAVAIILGTQIVLSSFFLSILRLNVRR